MTEDDGELVHIAGQLFYREYSMLCVRLLEKVPQRLRDEAMETFQDMSNIYSADLEDEEKDE